MQEDVIHHTYKPKLCSQCEVLTSRPTLDLGTLTVGKGREEEEEEEDSRERQARNEIAQDVAAGIKKASTHEDDKPTAQRTVGQGVKQNWDCSQVENLEEEEDEDWQKGTR